MAIKWEVAPGRLPHEPRDMQADTTVLEHGYWSCGPEGDGAWSLTLVEQDEDLEVTFEWQWTLASEAEVQSAAQAVEDSGQAPAK